MWRSAWPSSNGGFITAMIEPATRHQLEEVADGHVHGLKAWLQVRACQLRIDFHRVDLGAA